MAQPDRAANVLKIVEWLDTGLSLRPLAIEVVGVFFLNLRRVLEHDGSEIARGRSAVDRSGETLTDQVGQVAAVVDVSMTEDDEADVPGIEGEFAVAAMRLGTTALEQAAVQQQPPSDSL